MTLTREMAATLRRQQGAGSTAARWALRGLASACCQQAGHSTDGMARHGTAPSPPFEPDAGGGEPEGNRHGQHEKNEGGMARVLGSRHVCLGGSVPPARRMHGTRASSAGEAAVRGGPDGSFEPRPPATHHSTAAATTPMEPAISSKRRKRCFVNSGVCQGPAPGGGGGGSGDGGSGGAAGVCIAARRWKPALQVRLLFQPAMWERWGASRRLCVTAHKSGSATQPFGIRCGVV